MLDPVTGFLRFDTRAPREEADSSTVVRPVTADDVLNDLPALTAPAQYGPEERRKYHAYAAERAGTDHFIGMDDNVEHFVAGVDTGERVERPQLRDECEMVVVGAGFSGLLLWYQLRAAGFLDVRFCEIGGDVGGTWYWNRYPGLACDVESYSYLPLLDETGYIPTMKYAPGTEILQYCYRIAEEFGFYERCLFHTAVENATWNGDDDRWIVRTDRGDEMRARFLVLANGSLTSPQLPDIDGMEKFAGTTFHSSRWRHDVDLAGKVVGLIGTGATAVQLVPELASVASELYVFQRTPSTVDIRNQRATTNEERERWANEPGWSRARRERFEQISDGRSALIAHEDFLSGRVSDFKERKKHDTPISKEELVNKQLTTNFRIMEQIRARIDEVVVNAETAQALKPYYTYGCKRPTLHDEFLAAFNQPHVHLIDTSPGGVAEINERGVVHKGREYPLDVLIYATGFKFLDNALLGRVVGKNGESISQKWQIGTSTFLGLQSRGFPNLFILGGPQGGPGGGFNYTYRAEAQCRFIVSLLDMMRGRRATRIDVTEQAEREYTAHCQSVAESSEYLFDCPSYYNAYGKAKPGDLAYRGGTAWFKFADAALGSLDAFELNAPAPAGQDDATHRTMASR